MHVAVLFEPSCVFAVIVAVPGATAVTTPDRLTFATFVLLLDHVIFLFATFDGVNVTFNAVVFPIPFIVVDEVFSFIDSAHFSNV